MTTRTDANSESTHSSQSVGERFNPAQRQLVGEVMDDPALERERHWQALRGLQRINFWSRTAASLWPAIGQACAAADRPLKLLDIACGGGDVARSLAAMAQRRGVALEVAACDKSPAAIELASQLASKKRVHVDLSVRDIIAEGLPEGYDIITCNLFLHHLSTEQAGQLLVEMTRAAERLVVVSDLLRRRRGYFLAHLAGRVLSRSDVVRIDGPRSVAAAFTHDEIRELTTEHSLSNVQVRPAWPQRFLLTWRPGK